MEPYLVLLRVGFT